MNLFQRVGRWLAKDGYSSHEGWFFDWITGGAEADSGIKVSFESAQRSATVYGCVQVLSQDIAKLPLKLYRRNPDGKGRQQADSHALYRLLGSEPNSHQTSFEWRETMMVHFLLRGNAYSLIERDGRFTPSALVPLHPDWVKVVVSPDGTPFYDVRMWGRQEVRRLSQDDILHVKDRSEDGYIGQSKITQAKNVIGHDLASSKHSSKLFANGAQPGGLLIHPGKVGKEGRKAILKEWTDQHGGEENRGKVAVMAEGMDFKPIAMSNVDAEFIESRKVTRAEIAGCIFRVPLHKLGILDNATFSNIEHQSLEYVTDSLLPIATKWEQALNMALLREAEKTELYFKFLFDALLRGDFVTRMSGYATARNWGWLSVNDIREKEEMNPIPKGDEYLQPLNMVPIGTPPPEKAATPPSDPPPEPPAKMLNGNGAHHA